MRDQRYRGDRLMFRLRAALSAVFVAAGLALAVSIFVVSVVAPSARSEETQGEEESPSEAQYAGEQGEQKEDPTGYDQFYDNWTDSLATAPEETAPSQGSEPLVQAPEEQRRIMEPPTPYSQVIDNATPGRF